MNDQWELRTRYNEPQIQLRIRAGMKEGVRASTMRLLDDAVAALI